MSDSTSIMEFRGTHQAFRDRWAKTDDEMCKHSMSFHLHNTLRKEFFASYLYLLEQIPLVKLYAVTCEYIKGEKQFYYRAQNFYKDVPASEEGMMGDFVEISEIDLEGSRQFLKKFVGPGKAGTKRALDCGCGIGRVSKGVLFPVFESMEMLDMMEEFILHAHECYLGDYADRVEAYYLYNLQEFIPPTKRYDVIWLQWVACHLTDKDLMEFLMRAKQSLRPNGVIIIKDNMARQGCKLDPIDSSIIRHLDIMKNIIQTAGLTILDVEKQEGFPEAIVPVWMIAMH
ncbi:alpha N-terminal protein methyltransferase 1B [Sinocyclocheilus anshuiensis]|uniref:Alpha N-terminal protein methyltransferase 1B n=1 Tax=Sinocyclocheilus anshuiensis TaxID=1608454 RepID=A0A671PKD5_9TELE|nr:PREDICTED: alpha N-terminal protein methyltransferase 1B [Sinocyclocheilus anshuiensis]